MSIKTEADTRLKIIDRFFIEILGWTHGEIQTEEDAGKDFLDYKLSINGTSRVVVEAKRLARDFELLSYGNGNFYKLSGTLMKNKDVREGIDQAIKYAAYKGTELACVTNGKQWIVFLTRLLSEGKDIDEGFACIFNGIEDIGKNFKMFFNLLAHDQVKKHSFRDDFYKQERTFHRISDRANVISPIKNKELIPQDQLHKDIDKLLRAFFQDIIDESDDTMLNECFVTSKESEYAEKEILRLSEELINDIKFIDPEGDGLAEKVEDFSDTSNLDITSIYGGSGGTRRKKKGEIVLLAGIKGAGKSTFIRRFFRILLPNRIGNKFECFTIDLLNFSVSKDMADRINLSLIEQLDERPVQKGSDAYDYIRGCFFKDYRRLSETTMKPLYESDKEAFKIEFGKMIEELRAKRPQDYASKILDRIYSSEKKVPCVVIDNADHYPLEIQNIIYQNVVALSKNCATLIILPITDKTSWHVAEQSALQSCYTDSYYLPAPNVYQIFRKRIDFILRKTLSEDAIKSHGFMANGIKFEIDNVNTMVDGLKKLLLDDREISNWLFMFTNGNIRECMVLVREMLSSPHLSLSNLYKAGTFAGKKNEKYDSSEMYDEIKRSMIRSRYDRYPGSDSVIKNVFNVTNTDSEIPSFCIRMLHHLNIGSSESNLGFLPVDSIFAYFKTMGASDNDLRGLFNSMLQHGLCLSHDPAQFNIENVNRIRISLAGKKHLEWAMRETVYLEEMIKVTPMWFILKR